MSWWGPAMSALALVLALTRLGGSALWADEAFTGLLANEILRSGLPGRGTGDVWILTPHHYWTNDLWTWDGWLQAYLSAAGQAIFGSTSLGARFFHTVAGALVPWAAHPFFRKLSSRRGVAEAATLLTALSVPLLLFMRQAHYYAEGTLLTILVLRAYLACLNARPWAAPALVLWSVLLFHANFSWMAFVGLGLSVHLLLVRPPLRMTARLLGAALAAAVIIAPFAIWTRVWSRDFVPGGRPPIDPYVVLAFLRHYVLELNLHVAPVVLLLLGAAAAAGREHPFRAAICLLGAGVVPITIAGTHTAVVLWAFTGVTAVFILLGLFLLLRAALIHRMPGDWIPSAIPATVVVSFVGIYPWIVPYPFFRYLVPILPLLAFFLAASVFALAGRAWLAWVVVALVACTNVFSVAPVRWAEGHVSLAKIIAGDRSRDDLLRTGVPSWTRAPNLHLALFHEGWRPEGTPKLNWGSPLSNYLDEITHAFRGPIDAIVGYIGPRRTPGERFYVVYGGYSISFHTSMAPHPYQPQKEPPTWVIPRAGWAEDAKRTEAWIGERPYQEINLAAVDTPYQNRPEPDLHHWRTVRDGPRVRIRGRMR